MKLRLQLQKRILCLSLIVGLSKSTKAILVDKKRNVPVQMFTPRNSRDFSSNRSYLDPPHALKIAYVDGNNDWSTQEVLVYTDGFNVDNATKFDELHPPLFK